MDIYPYTDEYMDTYLVADLVTDLAAALATTDLIHDFATIDLATLRRPRHIAATSPLASQPAHYQHAADDVSCREVGGDVVS